MRPYPDFPNKVKILCRWIPLILFAVLCGCGEGSDKTPATTKKIVVATDTTLVPMSYINDRQELVGFEPDLMQAIARRAGLDIKMIAVEWPGLFGGLITHKFDMVISSVTILPERKRKMAFSIPYLKSGLSLVVRKDTRGVASVEDLLNKDLLAGAQVGTTAYFYLEKYPRLRKKGYQAYGHAIADLIKGEVDAVLGESTGTLYYKNRQQEYFHKIKMVGDILTEEYYGIVFRKDDASLRKRVNQALKQLLEDGTVRKLHDKWELGKSAQIPSPATRGGG